MYSGKQMSLLAIWASIVMQGRQLWYGIQYISKEIAKNPGHHHSFGILPVEQERHQHRQLDDTSATSSAISSRWDFLLRGSKKNVESVSALDLPPNIELAPQSTIIPPPNTTRIPVMQSTVTNTSTNTANINSTKNDEAKMVFKTSFLASMSKHWKTMLQTEGPFKVPFAIPRQQPIRRDSVSAVVHAGTTKLKRLLFLVQRWNGPVSLSIYIDSMEAMAKFISFYMTYQSYFQQVDFHFLLEDTELEYPHNRLRQMALEQCETDYFLALDVDFVPPPDAGKGLDELIRTDGQVRDQLQNRTLMVLPAFNRNLRTKVSEQAVLEVGNRLLPNTKLEALEMWERDGLEPFHLEKFIYGHGPTNYERWYSLGHSNYTEFSASKGVYNSYYRIAYEEGFEPYVLGYRGNNVTLPKYWEGFRGYGYNKYSWFVEAHYMGFRFGVLNDYFVVHLDHYYGSGGRQITARTRQQMMFFKSYMKRTYGLTKQQLRELD